MFNFFIFVPGSESSSHFSYCIKEVWRRQVLFPGKNVCTQGRAPKTSSELALFESQNILKKL
jgi:hypothetical protein